MEQVSLNEYVKSLEPTKKLHMVSFSGGKDSSAMLIRMLELGWQVDRILFADTGKEFPEMYEHIKKMDDWLQDKYKMCVETFVPDKTYDDWFYGKITRGHLKGRRRGWPLLLHHCWWSRESKFKVLDPIIGKHNVRYLGFAFDEPKRCKPKPNYAYPLAQWGWTEAKCLEYLTEKGLDSPLHHNFKRTGCFHCVKQGKKSLMTLCEKYPELWKITKCYDAESPHNFNPNFTLEEIEEMVRDLEKQLCSI